MDKYSLINSSIFFHLEELCPKVFCKFIGPSIVSEMHNRRNRFPFLSSYWHLVPPMMPFLMAPRGKSRSLCLLMVMYTLTWQYSNRSARTGCTWQHHSLMGYRPATAPSQPLTVLSNDVLTQHPSWGTWSPTCATANPTESTPDTFQVSETTSLACYWLFGRTLVVLHWYQRGRAPLVPFGARGAQPGCPFATLLW